jgi:HJR/Mrr/RecB family endonuclease
MMFLAEGFRITPMEIGLCFLATVVTGSFLMDALKARRERERFLSRPERATSIALDKLCPKCEKPLRGQPLPPEPPEQRDSHGRVIERAPKEPVYAWRVCFDCHFEERAYTTEPWTREQGDIVRREIRRDEERLVIQRYMRDQHLRSIATMEGLRSISPSDFEKAVAEILEANGYHNAYVCGGSGDLAVDIRCEDDEGRKAAVQCKQYSEKPVGSREMQTFIGMLHGHHNIEVGLYVTTSRFTKPAADLAAQHAIQLIDGDELEDMAMTLEPERPEDTEVPQLEMWAVVREEIRDSAARDRREKEMKRRRQAREWAGRRR